MLDWVKLENVGPAPSMEMQLAPRMNIITGDNGLGKSFLLDVAWWVLTRTWARQLVIPHPPPSPTGKIAFSYEKKSGGMFEYTSRFDRATDSWSVKQARLPIPGLVLYAQVDGGFSVWDPERNYWKKDEPKRPPAYLFSALDIWSGNEHCEGLIRDWASWQREDGEAFSALRKVLKALSPSPSEILEPGNLRKLTLDDPKRYPTLRMPYGQDVPVIHASAGMRRIVALAYLLVWAWYEHVASTELRGSKPAKQIIFLIDEIEAHLHPQWQRRIIPSLLRVMEALTGEHDVPIQLIAATHSPLVLASVEPYFDVQQDKVFLLEIDKTGIVRLRNQPWAKQGDVIGWLVSDTFGLQQGRSVEAERAIEAAEAWMRGEHDSLPGGLESVDAIHKELLRVLPAHDPFWPRWIVTTQQTEKVND